MCLYRASRRRGPGSARAAGARCGGGRQTGPVFTVAVVATVFWGWISFDQVVLVGCCPLSGSLDCTMVQRLDPGRLKLVSLHLLHSATTKRTATLQLDIVENEFDEFVAQCGDKRC